MFTNIDPTSFVVLIVFGVINVPFGLLLLAVASYYKHPRDVRILDETVPLIHRPLHGVWHAEPIPYSVVTWNRLMAIVHRGDLNDPIYQFVGSVLSDFDAMHGDQHFQVGYRRARMNVRSVRISVRLKPKAKEVSERMSVPGNKGVVSLNVPNNPKAMITRRHVVEALPDIADLAVMHIPGAYGSTEEVMAHDNFESCTYVGTVGANTQIELSVSFYNRPHGVDDCQIFPVKYVIHPA